MSNACGPFDDWDAHLRGLTDERLALLWKFILTLENTLRAERGLPPLGDEGDGWLEINWR